MITIFNRAELKITYSLKEQMDLSYEYIFYVKKEEHMYVQSLLREMK